MALDFYLPYPEIGTSFWKLNLSHIPTKLSLKQGKFTKQCIVMKELGYYVREFWRKFVLTSTSEIIVRTRAVTLCAFSDILVQYVFCHPAKMNELDELYFLENPLIKLLLLNGGKTGHVNQLFLCRDDKGEFQMLFQELWDQLENFFEYFRMSPWRVKKLLK